MPTGSHSSTSRPPGLSGACIWDLIAEEEKTWRKRRRKSTRGGGGGVDLIADMSPLLAHHQQRQKADNLPDLDGFGARP
eukprot:8962644-Pyramimonas_sp.AAC.1